MLNSRIFRFLLSGAFICTSFFASQLTFANEKAPVVPEHPTVVEETIVEASDSSPKAKSTVTIEPVAEKATSEPQPMAQQPKKVALQPEQALQPSKQATQQPKQAGQLVNKAKSEVATITTDPVKPEQSALDKKKSEEEHLLQIADDEKTAAVEKPQSEPGNADANLEVVDFLLAGKVESREPQNVVEAFGKDNERGFAFARLHAKAPSDVTFVWYLNDKPVARCKQSIQASKKWRTYSSVKLRPGQWKVQLLGENDSVLAEKTFAIE